MKKHPVSSNKGGFTIIELALVVTLIGLLSTLLVSGSGTVAYLRAEGSVKRLSETLMLLHYQAVIDQEFYKIEFDLNQSQYRVVVMESISSTSNTSPLAGSVPPLALEIANLTNPVLGTNTQVSTDHGLPSLANPIQLPDGVKFLDIRSVRGKTSSGNDLPFIMFSPRGFSEFGVVHLVYENNKVVSLLINPFTGDVKTISGYKDFEWTYGQKSS